MHTLIHFPRKGMMMLSPVAIDAIVAKLRFAIYELKMVLVEDGEAAADLQSIIDRLEEAVMIIQLQR